jgi:DNA-binding PadR family transcriptional regulator
MARKPSSGPAADPELLILSSLASGPKHGYGIMADVEQKLVAPDPVSGRQRPYRLTPSGAEVLEERLTAMRRVAAVGLRRLRTA